MSRKSFWIMAAAVVVIVPAATIAFWMFPQWERVPDVTKASELVLHPRTHQNMVYGVEIFIYGQLEGEAELLWHEGGKPYRVWKLSGDVAAHFTGDWYGDEIHLSFKPIHVTGGSLKLRYKFHPWYPTDPL